MNLTPDTDQPERPILNIPADHWRFSPKQREIFDSPARMKVLAAGRGFGKDIVFIYDIIAGVFEVLNEKFESKDGMIMNPLVAVWVVAPLDEQLDQLKRDYKSIIKDLFEKSGLDPDAFFGMKVREGDSMWILHPDWIRIEFKSAYKPDRLRGPGVDFLHMTEAAFCSYQAFMVLRGNQNRAGRSPRVSINSTWNGKNWFYRLHRKAGDKSNKNAAAFSATTFDNPFLTHEQLEEIELERELDEMAYRRERLNEVVEMKDGEPALTDFDPILTTTRNLPNVVNVKMLDRNCYQVPVSAGLDLARFGDDWTAWAVIQEHGGELIELGRYQRTSGPQMIGIMEDLVERYPLIKFHLDETGYLSAVSDFIPPEIADRVTTYNFSGTNKERLISRVNTLVAKRQIAIPDPIEFPFLEAYGPDFGGKFQQLVTALLEEWLDLQTKKERSGRYTFHPSLGKHDDLIDAFMLAAQSFAPTQKKEYKREDVENVQDLLDSLWI